MYNTAKHDNSWKAIIQYCDGINQKSVHYYDSHKTQKNDHSTKNWS